jgi:polysaccharide export outer membrane protein
MINNLYFCKKLKNDMKKYTNIICIALFALLVASCASTKKIPYMVGAESIPQEALEQVTKNSEPIIMPGDLLEILVTASYPEVVKPFNRMGMVYQMTGTLSTYGNNTTNSSAYYLVDNEGNIEFPVVGKLNIGGMNKVQAQKVIFDAISPKYIKEAPGIDIRFKNFKVSVLGEVAKPGVYTATNERFTILEALAMAGDLTIMGKRDDVMLIRTNEKGTREIHRIDLNDKNLVLSPYYNLQQNDQIYVSPNASKARSSWTIPPALTLGLSTMGTLISIATLIVTIVK